MTDIRVAICDDEAPQRAYLVSLIARWASATGRGARTSTFESAEAFWFAYAGDARWDVLLLDIQMGAMDGLTLARTIRARDAHLQIIFITGYANFMAEGYDVAALHFLVKPVQEDKLFAVLDRAVGTLQEAPRTVVLQVGGEYLRLPVHLIVYAEAFSHHVMLHTPQDAHRLSMRLSDLKSLLGAGFFQPHRSYLVNWDQVRKVTRTALVLAGDVSIPLSRARYEEANRAFIDHA